MESSRIRKLFHRDSKSGIESGNERRRNRRTIPPKVENVLYHNSVRIA